MEAANRIPGDKDEKQFVDEYMFCFRNSYTENETVFHMKISFPTGKESKKAYLKDAEACWSRRCSQGRDTSEEAKNSQGEASTSHKCERNCKKRYPKIPKN
ncbi:hypothetical protein AtEden1_Chr1g0060161 [Arabidopsis thaliana]